MTALFHSTSENICYKLESITGGDYYYTPMKKIGINSGVEYITIGKTELKSHFDKNK